MAGHIALLLLLHEAAAIQCMAACSVYCTVWLAILHCHCYCCSLRRHTVHGCLFCILCSMACHIALPLLLLLPAAPYSAWLPVLYTVQYGLPYCTATATAAPCRAIQCMVACACLYCLVLYCLAGHIALLLWNSSYACCTTVSRASELISLACMLWGFLYINVVNRLSILHCCIL